MGSGIAPVRVAVSLTVKAAELWRDGVEILVPDELTTALADAFRAVDAVVEGHLTTVALQSGEGALPARRSSAGSATRSWPRISCGWTVNRWWTCRSWNGSGTWRPSSNRRTSSA